MKTPKFLALLIFLSITTVALAQQKVKHYTFTYVTTSQNSFYGCSKYSIAYVSPIVSYRFEKYRTDPNEIIRSRTERKWKNKVKANYNVEKYSNCFVSYSQYWDESYSTMDEERDKQITWLKSRGYTVYINHNFGFSMPND